MAVSIVNQDVIRLQRLIMHLSTFYTLLVLSASYSVPLLCVALNAYGIQSLL